MWSGPPRFRTTVFCMVCNHITKLFLSKRGMSGSSSSIPPVVGAKRHCDEKDDICNNVKHQRITREEGEEEEDPQRLG